MSEEEFDLIKREDLTKEARPYYDCEKAQRVPGWRYEEPGPEAKYRDLILLQERLKKKVWQPIIVWGLVVLVSVVISVILQQNALAYPGPLFVAWMYINQQRTGYVVLWLRRFHRKEHKSFQILLEGACKYLGLPITVQDSSFRYSYTLMFTRSTPYVGSFLLVGAVLGYLVFIISSLVDDRVFGLPTSFVVPIVLATLVALAFWLFVALVLMPRFGYITLHQTDSQTKTLRLFKKIRTGKGRNSGTMVMKCEDEFWRDVVTLCLRHADAVVVDVTELSDNVLWELQTALALKPPECILLACATDGSAIRELPATVASALQAATCDVQLGRFPTFCYPRTSTGEVWTNPSTFITRDLHECLTKCISHAPSHDTSGVF